jgi:hypothetical protein
MDPRTGKPGIPFERFPRRILVVSRITPGWSSQQAVGSNSDFRRLAPHLDLLAGRAQVVGNRRNCTLILPAWARQRSYLCRIDVTRLSNAAAKNVHSENVL